MNVTSKALSYSNKMFSFGMLICALFGLYSWIVIIGYNEFYDVPISTFLSFFIGFCLGAFLVKCIIEVLEK